MDTRAHLAELYLAAAKTIYPVLENLDDKVLDWKPEPESRSIAGIVRHLVRVDLWFMSQFGIEIDSGDPGEVDARSLYNALVRLHDEIVSAIVSEGTNLAGMNVTGTEKISHSFAETIVHMSHHYLYHLAQVIYLRRAKDRDWQAPLALWEAATYAQGSDLSVVKRILS